MRLGIKHKLVLAFLLSNALLASLMFSVSSWRFDQGFLAYVTQVEIQRMQPLLQELAAEYAIEQSWQPILDDSSRWNRLMREHFIQDNRPPRQGPQAENQESSPPPRRAQNPFNQAQPRDRPSPPPPRIANNQTIPSNLQEASFFDPRILLVDAQKKRIVGPPTDMQNSTIWLEVLLEQQIVGFVGITPREFVSGSLDKLFVDEQKTAYAWITLGSLTMALVIGLMLANFWLRPIRLLQRGLQRLSRGDYSQTLAISGQDELAQLADQFNLLAKTLSEHKSVQGQWLADISHELRTPVAILRGEIEALLDGVRPISSAAMASLHEEVSQLQALVSELHQLSLSDLGALKYQKSLVNFQDFMGKIIEQFTHVCNEKGLKLHYTQAATRLELQLDEHKFKQMFVNLFQNSLRYTDIPGELSVDWKVESGQLIIFWADSSPGVNEKEQLKLFDRLFRAESSRSRSTGGSGLGLAIVKNIIEAHSGSIVVSNSKLGGLLFTLSLPLTSFD